jgi:hypothetical protein
MTPGNQKPRLCIKFREGDHSVRDCNNCTALSQINNQDGTAHPACAKKKEVQISPNWISFVLTLRSKRCNRFYKPCLRCGALKLSRHGQLVWQMDHGSGPQSQILIRVVTARFVAVPSVRNAFSCKAIRLSSLSSKPDVWLKILTAFLPRIAPV